MNQRELKIASNIMALAARRKGGKSSRSKMLRMVMPYLSRESGDALADAIETGNSHKFSQTWNRVRDEIAGKIGHHRAHAATAGDVVIQEDAISRPSRSVEDFLRIYDDFGRWLRGESIVQNRTN
jgi:hypothetical protein